MAEKFTAAGDGNQNLADLEEKRANLTVRLQQREDERVADIQRKKEEKASTAASNESVDFFTDNFAQSRSLIERRLATTESLDKRQLTDHFDGLLVELQTLQKFLTDSTIFLTVYEVQTSQDIIKKLQSDIQEKRDKLLPKKKFAFKSKKKVGVNEKPAEEQKKEENKNVIEVGITGCSFADMTGEVLSKDSGAVNQKDVALARLSQCTVKLHGSPSAIHINKLVNCKVLSGPVSGSIFIDDCVNCTFVLPCQQLRIHNTTDTHFYIHVTSRAIIEDCSQVKFAPYNWNYDGIDKHYELSGLDRTRNSWDDIDDFNWLASDAHSPNWSIIPETDRIQCWKT